MYVVCLMGGSTTLLGRIQFHNIKDRRRINE